MTDFPGCFLGPPPNVIDAPIEIKGDEVMITWDGIRSRLVLAVIWQWGYQIWNSSWGAVDDKMLPRYLTNMKNKQGNQTHPDVKPNEHNPW